MSIGKRIAVIILTMLVGLSAIGVWLLLSYRLEPADFVLTPDGGAASLYRTTFSSDGELLAGVYNDGTIIIWEWKSQRVTHKLSLLEAGFIDEVVQTDDTSTPPTTKIGKAWRYYLESALVISPARSRIAFVSPQQAFVWSLESAELVASLRFPIELQDWGKRIESPTFVNWQPVAWANERDLLLAGDNLLLAWDTNKAAIKPMADLRASILAMKEVPQGGVVIVTCNAVWELDPETLQVSQKSRLSVPDDFPNTDLVSSPTRVDVSPEGKLLALVDFHGHVNVFDCNSGRILWARKLDDFFGIDIKFVQGGKLLMCTAFRPRVARILRSQDGSPLCDKRLRGTLGRAAAWNGFLAAGCASGPIYIYNTTSWLQPSE